MAKISLNDVKNALLDERFRDSLPSEFQDDVQKFLKNPGCACNHPIYMRLYKEGRSFLKDYFPTKDKFESTIEELEENFQNDWEVINCDVEELASKLQQLRHGRKQIELSRWNDKVTVIVNHLNF